MGENADVSVADSCIGDEGKPKTVLEIDERVALNRHSRFCDLESEREKHIANHIETQHQLNRTINEDTTKCKELIN